MEYNLEMCGTYKQHKIGSKNIYVFESHNMALPVWGTYSSQSNEALNLITFDTHTDTRNPFARFLVRNGSEINRNYMKDYNLQAYLKDLHYMRDDFRFEDVWSIATVEVANDEHIQTAFDWGYLASYTVICNRSTETLRSYQQEDNAYDLPACYISSDTWHENSKCIAEHLSGKPVALDFDLDFFRCEDDANKKFWDSIASIVKQSSVITVAREREYFSKSNLESSFTNDKALDILINNIQRLVNS